jgi:hypothetical protein
LHRCTFFSPLAGSNYRDYEGDMNLEGQGTAAKMRENGAAGTFINPNRRALRERLLPFDGNVFSDRRAREMSASIFGYEHQKSCTWRD